MHKNGKYRLAHRVAYELFIGPIPEGLVVCHRCDIPLCVNPSHLFLGTPMDNQRDKIKKGRQAKGAKSGTPKLTEQDIREIRAASGSQQSIADRYGCSQVRVSQIKRGKGWRHVL